MNGLTPTAIQNQVDLLFNNLNGIKGALVSKGCDIEEGDPLSDYAEKIAEMSAGGGMEKVTFADGYCLVDRNTNWCITVLNSTCGTMEFVEAESIPQRTETSTSSGFTYTYKYYAYTAYKYKREITLPVSYKSINWARLEKDVTPQGVKFPLSNLASTTRQIYEVSTGSGSPSIISGLANSGEAIFDELNKVTVNQEFANTNTYTPTATFEGIIEGEIEPLS